MNCRGCKNSRNGRPSGNSSCRICSVNEMYKSNSNNDFADGVAIGMSLSSIIGNSHDDSDNRSCDSSDSCSSSDSSDYGGVSD